MISAWFHLVENSKYFIFALNFLLFIQFFHSAEKVKQEVFFSKHNNLRIVCNNWQGWIKVLKMGLKILWMCSSAAAGGEADKSKLERRRIKSQRTNPNIPQEMRIFDEG